MNAKSALDVAGGPALVEFTHRYLALAGELLGPFDGGYLLGSVAAGEADPRVSDLDVLLITGRGIDHAARMAAGTQLADAAAACPLRGVELVIYRRDGVAAPTSELTYELNVNGGPHLRRNVSTAGEPGFWFLLDVAAARDLAMPLFGPESRDLIGEVPPDDVRSALVASLRWHLTNAGAAPDAVLNAARAWYWLEHGRWVAKTAAARWAATVDGRGVLRAALDARARGDDGAVLDLAEVARLQRDVLARVLAAE